MQLDMFDEQDTQMLFLYMYRAYKRNRLWTLKVPNRGELCKFPLELQIKIKIICLSTTF